MDRPEAKEKEGSLPWPIRYWDLPLWQRAVAGAIFASLTFLRIVVFVRRGDPLWSLLVIPSYLLLSLNFLGLCFHRRQRTEIRRLEAEGERLRQELAELERERAGRSVRERSRPPAVTTKVES